MSVVRRARWGFWVGVAAGVMGVVGGAGGGWSQAAAWGVEAASPAAAYLANRLVDDARLESRDPNVSKEVAAAGAAIELQVARSLNPDDLRLLHLLADAARTADKPEVEREALRGIIKADAGDLVAQVRYIDLIASGTQALDERAKIYQAALGQATLDPQIRSQMALRLAQAALERGDDGSARDFLKQAVSLNNINVAALRELVRMAPGDAVQRLPALSALLNANPMQPDAWLATARILEASNLHERAASFLDSAIRQYQLAGSSPPGDLYMELAIELGAGGKPGDAQDILTALAKLPDVPLTALAAAQLTAGQTVSSSTASQPADTLTPQLEKRLADLAKAGTPAALADAAGLELAVMPALGPDTEKWVQAYTAQVVGDDATAGRLHGWLLYRQGKLEAAAAALEKLEDTDPLAQLGLARILLDQDKKAEATRALQELWNGHPVGLLALQVTRTARLAKITLADTPLMGQITRLLNQLPASLVNAYRQPQEMMPAVAVLRRPSVTVGEPMMMTVRITNVTDRALSVGEEGTVPPTIGLMADTQGVAAVSFGLYAVENIQRSYRLEPHTSIEASIRVDQGELGNAFLLAPVRTFDLTVTVITGPRPIPPGNGSARWSGVPGLGGQVMVAGDVQRGGMSLNSPPEFQKLLTEVGTLSGEKQLIRIENAGALLSSLVHGGQPATESSQKVQSELVAALRPLVDSKDPLVRASLLRVVPAASLGGDFDQAIENMGSDPEVVVRASWALNEAIVADQGGDFGRRAYAALGRRAAVETEPLMKEWMTLLLAHHGEKRTVRVAASAPGSAPATAPGSAPASAPATQGK